MKLNMSCKKISSIAIVVALLVATFVVVTKTTDSQAIFYPVTADGIMDPSVDLDRDTQNFLQALGQHIMLPSEKPLLSRITDAQTLATQQNFYRGSSDGDILVLFPLAAKAMIYSVEHDILVNVGPISVENTDVQ